MKFLGDEDFRETKIGSKWNPFDCLVEVARVARKKFKKEEKKPRWGLKYFKHTVFKEEDVGGLTKQGKNKRKRQSKGGEEGEELKLIKRSKKDHQPVCLCPNPPPFLPENLQQLVLEKGGSDLALVIQKSLFKSDVNPQESRFSIPFSQIQTHGFLTETEAADLDGRKPINVCLLEPSMKETFLSLKRWNMQKSSMYVLTTQWNSVVQNNGLQVNDIVQLWSFRVDSSLCFVLVKVPSLRQE